MRASTLRAMRTCSGSLFFVAALVVYALVACGDAPSPIDQPPASAVAPADAGAPPFASSPRFAMGPTPGGGFTGPTQGVTRGANGITVQGSTASITGQSSAAAGSVLSTDGSGNNVWRTGEVTGLGSAGSGTVPVSNGSGSVSWSNTLPNGLTIQGSPLDSSAVDNDIGGQVYAVQTFTGSGTVELPTTAHRTVVILNSSGAITFNGANCGGLTCTASDAGRILWLVNTGAGVTLNHLIGNIGDQFRNFGNVTQSLNTSGFGVNSALYMYNGSQWLMIEYSNVTNSATVAFTNTVGIDGSLVFSQTVGRMRDQRTAPNLSAGCGTGATVTAGWTYWTLTTTTTAIGTCTVTLNSIAAANTTCWCVDTAATPPTVPSVSCPAVSSAVMTIGPTGLIGGHTYSCFVGDH